MKKLYRSASDRKIAGICGGLGEMFQVDPTFIRLAFVFFAVITGIFPCLAVYAAGWLIIPVRGK